MEENSVVSRSSVTCLTACVIALNISHSMPVISHVKNLIVYRGKPRLFRKIFQVSMIWLQLSF